jgi:hypothetical protein
LDYQRGYLGGFDQAAGGHAGLFGEGGQEVLVGYAEFAGQLAAVPVGVQSQGGPDWAR